MRFLGRDTESEGGQSPTIWDDGDCYVIQGWRITDEPTLAEIGKMPHHETVLRLPKRMVSFLPEVGGGRVSGA